MMLNFSLEFAVFRPHEFVELPLHIPALRLFLIAESTIPGEHSPYPKTDRIQQQGVFGPQSCFQAGYGYKGAKQEKYSAFHT